MSNKNLLRPNNYIQSSINYVINANILSPLQHPCKWTCLCCLGAMTRDEHHKLVTHFVTNSYPAHPIHYFLVIIKVSIKADI